MKLKQLYIKAQLIRIFVILHFLKLALDLIEFMEAEERNVAHVNKIIGGNKMEENKHTQEDYLDLTPQEESLDFSLAFDKDDVIDTSLLEFESIF